MTCMRRMNIRFSFLTEEAKTILCWDFVEFVCEIFRIRGLWKFRISVSEKREINVAIDVLDTGKKIQNLMCYNTCKSLVFVFG